MRKELPQKFGKWDNFLNRPIQVPGFIQNMSVLFGETAIFSHHTLLLPQFSSLLEADLTLLVELRDGREGNN